MCLMMTMCKHTTIKTKHIQIHGLDKLMINKLGNKNYNIKIYKENMLTGSLFFYHLSLSMIILSKTKIRSYNSTLYEHIC